MVAEDELLVEDTLLDGGHVVAGPFADLPDALRAAQLDVACHSRPFMAADLTRQLAGLVA
jgi:hypothetical protein